MLNPSVLASATSLSNELAARKIIVMPVDNGLLARLQTMTDGFATATIMDNQNSVASLEDIATGLDIQTTAHGEVITSSEHTTFVEEQARLAAGSVLATFTYARNQVNPLVRSVVEEITKESQRAAYDIGANVEIVCDDLNDIYTNPALSLIVNQYAANNIDAIELPKLHKAKDEAQIEALLKTGADRVDGDILTWSAALPKGFLAETYDSVFVGGQPIGNLIPLIDGNLNLDRALAVFLMARSLINEGDYNARMMPSMYEARMTRVMAQTALAIKSSIGVKNSMLDSDVMVLRWPSDIGLLNAPCKVLVVGERYREFLQLGGTSEMVLGAAVSKDRPVRMGQIQQNGAYFATIWESHLARVSNALKSRQLEDFIGVVRRCMSNEIDRRMQDHSAGVNAQPLTLEQMHKTLYKETCELTLPDIEAPFKVVRHIVCKVFYPERYEILRCLEQLDAVMSSNPSLPAREAADIVAVHLLTDWLVDQMDVRTY